ncbi:MAG TPA: hypothetical protein VGF89_04155 [Steroidobacteraceae bacterium]|jgi:hypothetical protein
MLNRSVRLIATTLPALTALAALAAPAHAAEQAVSLTQDPLVMRLSKDEFRIAFGIHADDAPAVGCRGEIRYRVDWRTEDGLTRSESRRINYTIAASAARAIAVDRQYFDTAEGQHTTDVVKVSVQGISCRDPLIAARTGS